MVVVFSEVQQTSKQKDRAEGSRAWVWISVGQYPHPSLLTLFPTFLAHFAQDHTFFFLLSPSVRHLI